MATLDIRELVIALEQHHVRYVLVGSVGAIAYGARLATEDLDLCPATDDTNLQRIAALLQELDATLLRVPARGLDTIDLGRWRTLRLDDPAEHHLFETRYGALDIVPAPLGAGGWGTSTSYAELSQCAVPMRPWNVPIAVADFAAIAASKRAAGRPQDRAAEPELRRVAAALCSQPATGAALERYAAAQVTRPTSEQR